MAKRVVKKKVTPKPLGSVLVTVRDDCEVPHNDRVYQAGESFDLLPHLVDEVAHLVTVDGQPATSGVYSALEQVRRRLFSEKDHAHAQILAAEVKSRKDALKEAEPLMSEAEEKLMEAETALSRIAELQQDVDVRRSELDEASVPVNNLKSELSELERMLDVARARDEKVQAAAEKKTKKKVVRATATGTGE
jgi:phage shock protein A